MAIINTPGKLDFAGRDGFTWWVGEVEKVEADKHRCKVRVLGWYTGNRARKNADPNDGSKGAAAEKSYLDDVKTDELPWAYVLLPNDQEGIKDVGSAVRLQVGAVVLGFFADGDEAQVPIIMGNLKGYKLNPNTTFADTKYQQEHQAATQAQSVAQPGKTSTVTGNDQTIANQSTPAPGAGAGVQEARGTPSALTPALPGNSATNPAKLDMQEVQTANGINGPAGSQLEGDLRRMLTYIGQAYASVIKNEKGEFISVVTGKLVKINHLLDNIKGFISRAITGIMSWLKEFLAKAIQKIIDIIVGIISNFIPLGVTLAILELIQFILELFCNFEAAYILGYIRGALSDVGGFLSSMANKVLDKVLAPAFAFAQKVESTINNIIGRVQQALNQAISIGNTIISTMNTIKGVAKAMGNFKDIFKVDFTKLDWKSIIAIIKMLLGLFIKKDCGRTPKNATPKMWLPLLGTTECDSIADALKNDYQLPLKYADRTRNKKLDVGKTLSNFANNMWEGMDLNLVKVTSNLNGAWELHDSTKGKEKKVVQGPGAVSTIEDAKGNVHKAVPNNDTRIIGKDSCELVKGHKVMTIEGDLTLKVMGNFNLEVAGAVNKHISAGMDVAKGDNKQPKLVATEASDKDINQQGDIKMQAPNIKFTAISNINLKASSIKNECVSMTNSVDGECLDEFGTHTTFVNSLQTTIIALLNPLAPITGRITYMQGADMTIIQEKLIGIPGVPPVKFDVTLGIKQPTGFIRLANGAQNATSIDLMQGATAAAGRFVQGASGLIVDANNSGGGASVYHNAIGVFAAGCLVGPAQFYGLPIFLN